MSNEKHYINCIDGLVARLISIFIKLRLARQNKSKLFVYWPINEHCVGHFLDVFHPIKDIIFVEKKVLGQATKINWEDRCQNTYSQDLKLLPHIEKKILYIQNKTTSNYIATHVRRTDIFNLSRNQPITKNEQFFKWIDAKISRCNLYLATDNKETQTIFLNRYNDKIFINEKINLREQKRQTSLEHAVIDLFICIYSKDFMGTNWSCWSGFIKDFRKSVFSQIKQL